jgi:hypothetical protein
VKRFLETWHSDNNREERHFFLKNAAKDGYQEHAYLFGYNPQIISESQIDEILKIIESSNVYQKLNFGQLD